MLILSDIPKINGSLLIISTRGSILRANKIGERQPPCPVTLLKYQKCLIHLIKCLLSIKAEKHWWVRILPGWRSAMCRINVCPFLSCRVCHLSLSNSLYSMSHLSTTTFIPKSFGVAWASKREGKVLVPVSKNTLSCAGYGDWALMLRSLRLFYHFTHLFPFSLYLRGVNLVKIRLFPLKFHISLLPRLL